MTLIRNQNHLIFFKSVFDRVLCRAGQDDELQGHEAGRDEKTRLHMFTASREDALPRTRSVRTHALYSLDPHADPLGHSPML